MMRFIALCGLLLCATTQAAPWIFAAPIPVTAPSAQQIFTHLESAGRKNIAVSAGWVAVVWEDNRDGVPRGYVALKGPGQQEFGNALRISGKEEAAEPAIVGVGGGRFAMAWEEAGHVVARTVKAESLGVSLDLGKNSAAQASLGFESKAGLYAVWSETGKHFQAVKLARITVKKDGLLHSAAAISVDGSAKGDQAYPSLAVLSANKTVVGWEDRRTGHTRILYAVTSNGGEQFAPAQELNKYNWRGSGFKYGNNTGTGAMRVALSSLGNDGAVAVWADKRDFQSGYDGYAAVMRGPGLKFGANEKAQDEFGNNIAQWHPAVAANAKGSIAAVWDDDRDGTPDIWLSWRDEHGWSDNIAVPGASGSGVQSDPSIVMDEDGNLHLAWVEKADLNAPSSIRYVFGHAQ